MLLKHLIALLLRLLCGVAVRSANKLKWRKVAVRIFYPPEQRSLGARLDRERLGSIPSSFLHRAIEAERAQVQDMKFA